MSDRADELAAEALGCDCMPIMREGEHEARCLIRQHGLSVAEAIRKGMREAAGNMRSRCWEIAANRYAENPTSSEAEADILAAILKEPIPHNSEPESPDDPS